MKSLSHVRLFANPRTVAHQAPLSMGFSWQEYWSGLPFLSPGDLPNPGIEPRFPALQADAFALTSEPPGKSGWTLFKIKNQSINSDFIKNQKVLIFVVLLSFEHFEYVLTHCGLAFTFYDRTVQFSCSVMSHSLWPHEPQQTRPPCPSPIPGVYPNSFPLIESVMPSNCLILCHPFLLLPSIFPSIRGFSNESALCIRWPKYWSFSFNISPSNEHSGLISFRMDWLDLLEVQGTVKSLLQHHSSKAAVLQAQLCLYSPTLTSIHDYWKNHSLGFCFLICCLGWS